MIVHTLMAFSMLSGLALAGELKRIRSRRTVEANLPFSDAVWAGDTLYLSGHLGLDPKTGEPGDTPEAEAPDARRVEPYLGISRADHGPSGLRSDFLF